MQRTSRSGFLGSTTNLINGVSFYHAGRPATLDVGEPRNTPWADAAAIAPGGIALACPEPDPVCMHFMNQRAGDAKRTVVTLSRVHLGFADTPVRYVIAIQRPGFAAVTKQNTPAYRP